MRKVQAAGADGDSNTLSAPVTPKPASKAKKGKGAKSAATTDDEGIATPVKNAPEKKAPAKSKNESAKRAKSAAAESGAESGMFLLSLTFKYVTTNLGTEEEAPKPKKAKKQDSKPKKAETVKSKENTSGFTAINAPKDGESESKASSEVDVKEEPMEESGDDAEQSV
jgi:hypothetical protein